MNKKTIGKSVVYVKPAPRKSKKPSNLKPFRIITDTQDTHHANGDMSFDSFVNTEILPPTYDNQFDVAIFKADGIYYAHYERAHAKARNPHEAAKKAVKRFLRNHSVTTASSYK